MGLLWDLALPHPGNPSPNLADSAIEDGGWQDSLVTLWFVSFLQKTTCPWTHLPGFTREARVVCEAGDGTSGMCVWCVLGNFRPVPGCGGQK